MIKMLFTTLLIASTFSSFGTTLETVTSSPRTESGSDISESEKNPTNPTSGNTVLAVSIILMEFALGFFLVMKLNGRLKKIKQLNNALKAKMEAQQKEWDNIEKKLHHEVQLKTRELTNLSLNFIQKNELIYNLKESFEEIRKAVPEESKVKINTLLNGIQVFHQMDKEWENFKEYFDQVNLGFFDNLKTQYPSLNHKDLKLCALLRLNLETKQIATIMGVSPETAKVTRHRIRKKLGLTSDDNIQDFLNNFSSLN